MAIATFGPSFCCTRTEPTRVSRFRLAHSHKPQTQTRGLSISCCLNSSNSLSPADNNKYELHEGSSPQSRRNVSPVFVQLPEYYTMTGGKVNRRKAMVQSFKALAAAGVEGIVVEYMLASLNACSREVGMREWGDGGPIGSSKLMQDPEHTEFFRTDNGSWNTAYGNFSLEWYSGMLLLHGERICREAETIFRGTRVSTSAKVGGIHWHYGTASQPSELTADHFNNSARDGFILIACLFDRYGFTMCCSCFEMRDVDEKQMNPFSSPEGLLRQLLLAARICGIPLDAENSATSLEVPHFNKC